MKVSVKLFASFTKTVSDVILAQHPQGIRAGIPIEVELPSNSTLADLAEILALPREQIKVTFVNGISRELDHRLHSGDEIGIFPPVGGG
jgi:molybdopterin converting factor small subunit